MAILSGALAVLLLPFGRFERLAEPARPGSLPIWRVVLGTVMFCGGLALIAIGGVGSDGPPGVRVWVVLCAVVGAMVVGGIPLPRRRAEA